MTTPLCSLLHATYGRPEKAVAAMRDALAKAAMPESVEYIFAVNTDDSETATALLPFKDAPKPEKQWVNKIVIRNFSGSVPAWNAAAKASTGRILVQMQDDLELPQDWDSTLCWTVEAQLPNWDTPAVIRVSDGFRKDELLCTAIINRARYEQVGYFLWSEYNSVFSDDEFSVRAYADSDRPEGDMGRCQLLDRRDLVFRHNNLYHLKQPEDATCKRQNSAENYHQGGELFYKRNAHLLKYRTWN